MGKSLPLELELARAEVDESMAELERLLLQAEESYELMVWEHENEARDSD